MKKINLISISLICLVLCSCESNVDMTFDKKFGSVLNIVTTGDGVDHSYARLIAVGESKSDLEMFESICAEHEVARLEDEMRYKFQFNSIDQLNSFALNLENMSEYDGDESAPQDAYWADENILVLTKYFNHNTTSSNGPLGFLSSKVEQIRGESGLHLNMNFEYKIDSVLVIVPEVGVNPLVNQKSFTIDTDLQTIWADELEALSIAVIFKKDVKPK